MEFWGVEIKAGKPVKVDPELGTMIHVSQASLGETKKGSESAVLYMKVGDNKFVIGNLSHDKFPQLSFDLVLEKEFELSHNWKNGSVYVLGYKSAVPIEEDFSDQMDSDEEEPSLAPVALANGKPEKKSDQAPAKAAKPESSVKAVASKDDEDEDSDEDDDSDDSENESGSDEDTTDGESDDGSDDESDEEEEEETPKKVETGKKRSLESATKTPASKKAKANTPQKTDGKKSVHVDTPHPAKHAVKKTPGNNPQPQTPKAGRQFSCSPCKKSFNSDMGLQSHNKAKHSGK